MSYTTSYRLEARPVPSLADPKAAILELWAENEECSYCLSDDGETEESGKWYDHEADLLKHSLKFPHLVFVLSGVGEEAGDVWRKYFSNGKKQIAKASMEIADFDPGKLT